MKIKIFLFLAVLALFTAPSMAVEVLTDDPAVLDGNFAWSLSTNDKCILAGVPGTESVTTLCFEGGEWQQKPRLYPPTPEAGAQFGRRVKISDNNRLAGVCAPFDDQYGLNAGVLFLWEGPGDGTFPTFLQTLKGSDTNENDQFCSSLDFNSDGLAVAVGAAYADKAYLFTRSAFGQTFGNEKKFTYSGDDAGGLPGYSVCLDGNVGDNMLLAIGIPVAWSEAGGDDWFGRVEVREKNRGGTNNWGVRNGITFANAERIGWKVDCSREDNLVLAGAPLDMTSGGSSGFVPETTGQGRGAVYVIRLEGSVSFSLLVKLISPTPQSDAEFGRILGYDETSKDMLVCEPFSDVGGVQNAGRCHIYRFNGSTFVRTSTFTPPSPTNTDEVGLSGAANGGVIVAGSPSSDAAGPLDAGVAYVLRQGNIFSDGFESGSTSAWSATVP